MVFAQKRLYSGASNSISVDRKVQIEVLPDAFGQKYMLDSTPADCVKLRIPFLAQEHAFVPDLIVSGINAGANLGRDVLYNGTFGAAREGLLMGYPAIALSTMGYKESEQDIINRIGSYLPKLILSAVNNK
jgi:5'-nucleotidase